jgi:hypothetical protein
MKPLHGDHFLEPRKHSRLKFIRMKTIQGNLSHTRTPAKPAFERISAAFVFVEADLAD